MNKYLTKSDKHKMVTDATSRAIGVINKRSKPTIDHQMGLANIINSFCSVITDGDTKKRVAYPVPTGCGKTVTVVAFLTEMLMQGYQDTILVATETIREQTEIYKAIQKNVPLMTSVGVFHSFTDVECAAEGYQTCSKGDPKNYQIILISHAGVFSNAESNRYGITGPYQRSLVIWDEALIKADGSWMSMRKLTRAIAQLDYLDKYKFSTDELGVAEWLSKQLAMLHNKTQLMLKMDKAYVDVKLKYDDTFADFEFVEQTIDKMLKDKADAKVAKHLFGYSGKDIRLYNTNNDEVIIGYNVKLPESYRKIVILDASSTVRSLYGQDKSISVVDRFRDVNGNYLRFDQMKLYDNVTLTHYTGFKTGGHILNCDKDETDKARDRRELAENVADLILSIDANEEILLCTSKNKDKKKGFMDVLREVFESRGVAYPTNLVDITWGRHKAVNTYAHIKHLIAVGVQRRSTSDLAATSLGQAGYLDPSQDINRVSKTEQIAQLQQFIGRGTSRAMVGRYANESHIYLYEVEHFKNGVDLIQLAMPGVQYTQKSLKIKDEYMVHIKNLVKYLDNLEDPKVSIITLKRQSEGLGDLHKDTWKRIEEWVLDNTRSRWVSEGRSLVRNNAD